MIYLHTSRFLCLIDCAYLVQKSSCICRCVRHNGCHLMTSEQDGKETIPEDPHGFICPLLQYFLEGKLVIRPSLHKESYVSLKFLECIHGDIHGLAPPFWTILLLHGSQRCVIAFFSHHTSFYSQHDVASTPHPYHQVARSIPRFSN